MNSEENNSFSFKSNKILIPLSLIILIIFLFKYTDSDEGSTQKLVIDKEVQEQNKPELKRPRFSNRRVASKPRDLRNRPRSNQQALMNRAKKSYQQVRNDPTPQEDFLYDEEDKSRNDENPETTKKNIPKGNTLSKFSDNELVSSASTGSEPQNTTATEPTFDAPTGPTENTSAETSGEIGQTFIGNNNSSPATEDEENSEEKKDNNSSVNLAPNISADKISANVKEEESGKITVTANDPENIYIDFTQKNLPSFVSTSRVGNKLELNINPIFGDKGTYNFQIIASDDQGLTGTIDLEIVVSNYIFTVDKLQLVNSSSDTILGDLADGQIIDLAVVGDKLNIIADVPFAGSVKFESSDLFTQIENAVPFSYRGNIGPDFSDWTPVVGPISITVTPYELTAEGGVVGTPYIINLTIINSTP